MIKYLLLVAALVAVAYAEAKAEPKAEPKPHGIIARQYVAPWNGYAYRAPYYHGYEGYPYAYSGYPYGYSAYPRGYSSYPYDWPFRTSAYHW